MISRKVDVNSSLSYTNVTNWFGFWIFLTYKIKYTSARVEVLKFFIQELL